MSIRRDLLSVPLLSTALLYILSTPLYIHPIRAFYPMVILNQALAYVAVFTWTAIPIYLIGLLACLPGIGDAKYTVALIPIYTLVAYASAALVTRGAKARLASALIFWAAAQISSVATNIALAAAAPSLQAENSVFPTAPQAPFYFTAYLILATLHLAALKKLKIRYTVWIHRVVRHKKPKPRPRT